MTDIGPGDEVICIDTSEGEFEPVCTQGDMRLRLYGVYVIDAVGEGQNPDGSWSPGCTLVSPKGWDDDGDEMAFKLARFVKRGVPAAEKRKAMEPA